MRTIYLKDGVVINKLPKQVLFNGAYHGPENLSDADLLSVGYIRKQIADALTEKQSLGYYESIDANGNLTINEKPLAESQAAVKDAIKAKREELLALGYPCSGYWFHSDVYSLIQQQGLITVASQVQAANGDLSLPIIPIPWKTLDGTEVSMTGTLALSLLPAAMTQQGTIFAVASGHIAAMIAASEDPVSPINPADYDFSTGWPVVFGG